MNEKLRCNLCGDTWDDVTEEQREQFMMFHTLTVHPMDFLGHPKVQNTLSTFFEGLGGLLADKLRGKHGQS